jgi:hypothetical protein
MTPASVEQNSAALYPTPLCPYPTPPSQSIQSFVADFAIPGDPQNCAPEKQVQAMPCDIIFRQNKVDRPRPLTKGDWPIKDKDKTLAIITPCKCTQTPHRHCAYCDFTITSRLALYQRHINSHKVQTLTKKSVLCTICGLTLSSASLSRHLKELHDTEFSVFLSFRSLNNERT